ncbi:MAG: hypothetical protein K9J25_13060 [Bacteroidales bacterium]|nr:hypothetical protein [Bacteroidales bacterium]
MSIKYNVQDHVRGIELYTGRQAGYPINNSANIYCYSAPLNIEESGKRGTGELIIVDN